jgi:hypothetical protein
VWGFPLDFTILIANSKKAAPPNTVGFELAEYSREIAGELKEKCSNIWSSPGMITTTAHVFSPDNSEKVVIALLRSTRPDDSFLPPLDKMEELKTVFAEQGFMEEPGWFIEES